MRLLVFCTAVDHPRVTNCGQSKAQGSTFLEWSRFPEYIYQPLLST